MKKSFGPWLKDQLDQMGITQIELAHRINLDASQVSRVIKGNRGTTIEVLEAIADAINIDVDVVFHEAAGKSRKSVKSDDDLSPKKRELLRLAEKSDEASVEVALAVLRTAAEQKRQK
jgi:transcriptional regulator with XRE-family HTH domain